MFSHFHLHYAHVMNRCIVHNKDRIRPGEGVAKGKNFLANKRFECSSIDTAFVDVDRTVSIHIHCRQDAEVLASLK
jgi:hypothetical protein